MFATDDSRKPVNSKILDKLDLVGIVMEDEDEDQKVEKEDINKNYYEPTSPSNKDVKIYSWGENRCGLFNDD